MPDFSFLQFSESNFRSKTGKHPFSRLPICPPPSGGGELIPCPKCHVAATLPLSRDCGRWADRFHLGKQDSLDKNGGRRLFKRKKSRTFWGRLLFVSPPGYRVLVKESTAITRRFSARPSSVSLEAMGFDLPIPLTDRRPASKPPVLTKCFLTIPALFLERLRL